MSVLTTILYWLSTGMMIPVIVLLLLAFGWTLLLVGDLYGHYAFRLRSRGQVTSLLERVREEPVRDISLDSLRTRKQSLFTEHLLKLAEMAWHPIHGEKTISDFELASKRELDGPTTLMRVGPMLGLMGTLIPMGPALVGLAAGDIGTMASNMQVAFSTTVVGIFIGALGFVVQQIKQRWRQGDHAVLVYLFELSQAKDLQGEDRTG